MQFVFLSANFYNDYGSLAHIMKKSGRPYVRVLLEIDGVSYCVPMRSNINHPHALLTDKENRCGLDFGNTIIISDVAKYIDFKHKPQIRQSEFDALKGKERIVMQKLKKYLSDYKYAKQNMNIRRNRVLVENSSLQYFEEFIDF